MLAGFYSTSPFEFTLEYIPAWFVCSSVYSRWVLPNLYRYYQDDMLELVLYNNNNSYKNTSSMCTQRWDYNTILALLVYCRYQHILQLKYDIDNSIRLLLRRDHNKSCPNRFHLCCLGSRSNNSAALQHPSPADTAWCDNTQSLSLIRIFEWDNNSKRHYIELHT